MDSPSSQGDAQEGDAEDTGTTPGQEAGADAGGQDAGQDSPSEVDAEADSHAEASLEDSPADAPVDSHEEDSPVDSPTDSPPDAPSVTPCHDADGGVVGTGIEANPDTSAGACPAGQTNTGTNKDDAGNYCCIPTPTACVGVGTQTEATPNTAAGTCPPGQENDARDGDAGAGNYCCTQKPCFNGSTQVGLGIEANPNSAVGTCPTGNFNNMKDTAGNFCCSDKLVPCTDASQTGCVTCQDSTNSVCSPTEAPFVQRDIDLGLVTAAGADNNSASCYRCLANHSCLDNINFGVSSKECGDTGLTTGTAAECVAVISCVLGTEGAAAGTGCANPNNGGVNTCYCGTDSAANCSNGTMSSPVTTGVNGACDSQIATGLGYPLGDGSDIEANLTTTSLAGGRADQIFICASAASCSTNCF
jgi:hypothetical protein